MREIENSGRVIISHNGAAASLGKSVRGGATLGRFVPSLNAELLHGRAPRAIEMQIDEVQSGWAADALPSPQTFSRLIQTSCIRLYHLKWKINSLNCPLKPNCVFLGLAGATSCYLKSGWSPETSPGLPHTWTEVEQVNRVFWGEGRTASF